MVFIIIHTFIDLDCFDFSSKKFSHAVGELNPMLEFMPHTENGAPFTLSHAPSGATGSPQKESLWSGRKEQNYYYNSNPYYNNDEVEVPDGRNDNLDNYRSYLSSEHSVNEGNGGYSRNYASFRGDSTVTQGSRMYPWHAVEKQGRMSENYENTYEPSQRTFPDIASFEGNYGRSTPSRKLEHKSFQRNKQDNKSDKFLKNYNIVKKRIHKNFATNFKKRKTKRKQYRSRNKKYSRFQRIFNFKKVRRKISKQERKAKLNNKNRSDIRPKMSPDVSEMLRQNYEEIVNLLFDAFKMIHKKRYSSHHEHETRKDIYRHNLRYGTTVLFEKLPTKLKQLVQAHIH